MEIDLSVSERTLYVSIGDDTLTGSLESATLSATTRR
jgi:hypothetical protein